MKVRLRKGIHPVLKYLGISAIVLGLAGAAVFTAVYVHFSRIIDRRLSGPIFGNTSRVYAAPVPVFLGEPTSASDIAANLRRAAYSEVKTNRVGYYQMISGGIEIYPGP